MANGARRSRRFSFPLPNIRRQSTGLRTLKRAEARARVFMRWLLIRKFHNSSVEALCDPWHNVPTKTQRHRCGIFVVHPPRSRPGCGRRRRCPRAARISLRHSFSFASPAGASLAKPMSMRALAFWLNATKSRFRCRDRTKIFSRYAKFGALAQPGFG